MAHVPHGCRGGGEEGGHVRKVLVLDSLGTGADLVSLDGEVDRSIAVLLHRAVGPAPHLLHLLLIILDGILGFNFLKFGRHQIFSPVFQEVKFWRGFPF